jgi:hypothetical protein
LASCDDTVGRSLFALGGGQWDIPELRLLLDDVIPKSAAIIIAYEVNADFPAIRRRTKLVSEHRPSVLARALRAAPNALDGRVRPRSILLVLQKNPTMMGYGSKQQDERGSGTTRQFARYHQQEPGRDQATHLGDRLNRCAP